MNVVFWIQSNDSPFIQMVINILVYQYEMINIIGSIIDENSLDKEPLKINDESLRTIAKEELSEFDYDIIIVTGRDASLIPILNEAEILNIDPNKIVLDRTVCAPGFTMDCYRAIRKSKLTIFSINCWGGLIYHTLGLPFLSPTINMFTSDKDFIKFLQNPRYYMNKELRFYKINYEENLKEDYPVFLLGDIQWDMNHYGKLGIDGARQKWEERRLKINWYNLFVMMLTEDINILKQFDELPYSKKICFVPFETDIDSALYVKPELIQGRNREFYQAVNETAMGILPYFDLFDMLLYGKKTLIQ